MAPNPSVASWATIADLSGPCSTIEDDYGVDLVEIDGTLDAATFIVWSLSGRQYPGVTSDTLNPCAGNVHRYRTGDPSLSSAPVVAGWGTASRWAAYGCRHREVDRCGCRHLHQIDLGVYPLVAIEAVRIDGEVVSPDAYRIDDRRWLVRLDGDPWPACSDLTDPDGFAVDVRYGTPPPEAGVRAVAALACQMILARDPAREAECRLPRRATSVVRQGISVTVMDPFDFLDDGKTGVYEVDLFVKAANPHGLRRPPRVVSPDLRRRARRVGT